MSQLLKLYSMVFLLKANADDIPYSKVWLLLTMFLVFITKNFANILFVSTVQSIDESRQIELSLEQSSIIVLINILVMWALVTSVLSFYKIKNRQCQVFTCLLGVDFILTLLFIAWIGLLGFVQVPKGEHSLVGLFMVIAFVIMLYWQFVVYIHVLYKSLDTSILNAGLFSLAYMLIQHNVAEFLLAIMISSTT